MAGGRQALGALAAIMKRPEDSNVLMHACYALYHVAGAATMDEHETGARPPRPLRSSLARSG